MKLKDNWKIILSTALVVFVIMFIAGVWYSHYFFLLGVDSGAQCNTRYNNEYRNFSMPVRDRLYELCVVDYPDVEDTTHYLTEIYMENKQ